MRARSTFAFLVLLTIGLATLIGCSRSPIPDNPPKSTTDPAEFVPSKDDPNADIGKPLYAEGPGPKFPPPPMPGTDPVVIPNCTVNYEDRQVVSAEVEGTIDLIATPMARRPDGTYEYRLLDGTVITHDPMKFDPKNLHPKLAFSPREKLAFKDNPEKWVPYYKLRDGDFVFANQVLCMLDDSLITTKRDTAMRVKEASILGQKSAQEGVELTKRKIDLYKDKPGVVSPADAISDLITLSRFTENLAQSAQAIAKAEGEYAEALVMLRKHFVTTRVSGFIRNKSKQDGEHAHAGEKICEILSTETVRLEGTMDVQYFDRVKRNMVVSIEPAVPSTPIKSLAQHRQEVSGVAITGLPTRPLILSTSLDGTALVWDPNLANAKDAPAVPHALPHPVAVKCVACTQPGLKTVLAVTGADDGKVRVWDLANPAKLPKSPAREPADFHTSGVTAVAVSPDGKFAASAAGREVFIWNLESGKKLYSLPPEHRDSITAISFTPQTQLVTASRDKTIKVWRIGGERGAVARTIDHRSGVVDALGISQDGARVLFDQDKGRLDLVDLSDAQTVGQLANIGPNVAFSTLAAFSPDHAAAGTPVEQLPPYTIATAGGEGDVKGGLQVWEMSRAGGRAAERARLITPGRVAVTCATFSPFAESQFLVAGTAAGTVHIWAKPRPTTKKLEGRITNIDATDPRYVTVRVEMNNKELGLLDRSAATIIVNPGQ